MAEVKLPSNSHRAKIEAEKKQKNQARRKYRRLFPERSCERRTRVENSQMQSSVMM